MKTLKKKTTPGGKRPGAGRKETIAPGEHTVVFTLRLSESQRAKVASLGGGQAVRRLIDRARVSGTRPSPTRAR